MSVSIGISHVVERYDENTIIPDLSVEIKNGEFFTLLDPSGCGKTTPLRITADFNTIEGGEICFGDKVINRVDTYKRNIGIVFQNYAIFPHMTVRESVEYGLKLRKESKDPMRKKIDEILNMVQIQEYQDRPFQNLSDEQQQRVALARAIVTHPNVLLMDEPLSNLDVKLRIGIRSAIREVQHQVGITTAYVTHGQKEVLATLDRVAVTKSDVTQQVGTSECIYSCPANTFVSTFIKHSNLLHVTICREIGFTGICLANGYRVGMDNLADEAQNGQRTVVSIRPEESSLQPRVRARITEAAFLGKCIDYILEFEGSMVPAGQPSIEFIQDLGYSKLPRHVGDLIGLKPSAAKINMSTEDQGHSLVKIAVWGIRNGG